ncbi:MAG: DUF1501 domain-containing protein, partial [Verrucomicrobiaceae bacterium]
MFQQNFSNISRRSLLRSAGAGFGHLALAGLLGSQSMLAGSPAVNPLQPKRPHFTPRAKKIIFIFMEGAMS